MTAVTLPPPTRTRRTADLAGNRLVLAGALLSLGEFVGIIGTHVHTMPLLPGASAADIHATYAGQAGATGFLAGWYALVLPGRILITLGVRDALRHAGRAGALVDWTVALTALGVAVEAVSYCLLAGAAAAVGRGDLASAQALDGAAHYALPVVYCTGGVASVILASAMWASGVFPRMLAGLGFGLGLAGALSGALLSAPAAASLQDGLTVLSLLGIPYSLWLAILLFRRAPARALQPVSHPTGEDS